MSVCVCIFFIWASLVAQKVKNPPAMRETWVQSLGWEDPLEEGMAAQSSILVWRIPMDRGAWQATVLGDAKKSDRTERLNTFTFHFHKNLLKILSLVNDIRDSKN